jgi:hypothetical protein
MLDFFLDEEDNLKSPNLVSYIDPNSPPKSALYQNFGQNQTPQTPSQTQTQATPAQGGNVDVSASMNALKRLLSPELVSKTNGVYSFKITGINFIIEFSFLPLDHFNIIF